MPDFSPRLIITGGHHTSALQVALRLRDLGWHPIWFGHRHSMWGDTVDSSEYREVIASGFEFFDLKAGKIYHTLHPLKLARLPLGFIQAFVLLRRLKPQGIVSFGGYLAAPTVVVGWFLGIPSLTHEQTVVIGWANRLISHFATRIAVSWPQSLSLFPPPKTVLTGLPLRPQIANYFSHKPQSPHSKLTVYITGGKQGAHALNQAIFAALPRLLHFCRLIHQTGVTRLNSDFTKAQTAARKYSHYQAFGYDSALALSSLQQADVVVGRSGAHTAYELAVLGKPCVLVPLPNSSHSEQDLHAAILQKNHQAIVLTQANLSPTSLVAAIKQASRFQPRPLPLPRDGLDRLVELITATFSSSPLQDNSIGSKILPKFPD